MTTQQNDTAALTDEQLEEVAGGFIVGPISGRMRGSYVSISPVPTPIPKVLFPRGRARVDVGPIL